MGDMSEASDESEWTPRQLMIDRSFAVLIRHLKAEGKISELRCIQIDRWLRMRGKNGRRVKEVRSRSRNSMGWSQYVILPSIADIDHELPIGEDAHGSNVAGYSMTTGGSSSEGPEYGVGRVRRRQEGGRRRASRRIQVAPLKEALAHVPASKSWSEKAWLTGKEWNWLSTTSELMSGSSDMAAGEAEAARIDKIVADIEAIHTEVLSSDHDKTHVEEIQQTPSLGHAENWLLLRYMATEEFTTGSTTYDGGLLTLPRVVPQDEFATGCMVGLVSYFQRATDCLEAVRQAPARQFNDGQCQYLVEKLQVILHAATPFLGLNPAQDRRRSSSEGTARPIEIFKIVVASANEIKSFVKGCSRMDWIQAALTLTNVSEHVSSIGFNLELCRVAWSKECAATGLLSLDAVAHIHTAEVEVVKTKAAEDWENLVAKVISGLVEKSFTVEENHLAAYLLQRLHNVKPKPVHHSASSGESRWSVLRSLYKWVHPLEKLGRGISGNVVKATWLGTPVAKKTFPGRHNSEFKREAEILGGLCHPNITSMFCCTLEHTSCSIIMELMDGSLHDLMLRRCNPGAPHTRARSRPFTIFEAVDIMLQVAEGVNYLHNQVTPPILHRDLKSSNILVKYVCQFDSDIRYVHVKVTDFGLSKRKQGFPRYSPQTPNIGTSKWMAPEVIELDVQSQGTTSPWDEMLLPRYPEKSDVYSFAIVCYEILTGHEPFPDDTSRSVKTRVLKGERPLLPGYCPVALKALIEECWNDEPLARPSFDVICSKLKYMKYLLMTGFRSD